MASEPSPSALPVRELGCRLPNPTGFLPYP